MAVENTKSDKLWQLKCCFFCKLWQFVALLFVSLHQKSICYDRHKYYRDHC